VPQASEAKSKVSRPRRDVLEEEQNSFSKERDSLPEKLLSPIDSNKERDANQQMEASVMKCKLFKLLYF